MPSYPISIQFKITDFDFGRNLREARNESPPNLLFLKIPNDEETIKSRRHQRASKVYIAENIP
jgi:hypothetical protein